MGGDGNDEKKKSRLWSGSSGSFHPKHGPGRPSPLLPDEQWPPLSGIHRTVRHRVPAGRRPSSKHKANDEQSRTPALPTVLPVLLRQSDTPYLLQQTSQSARCEYQFKQLIPFTRSIHQFLSLTSLWDSHLLYQSLFNPHYVIGQRSTSKPFLINSHLIFFNLFRRYQSRQLCKRLSLFQLHRQISSLACLTLD
jgi:hypothetical protein